MPSLRDVSVAAIKAGGDGWPDSKLSRLERTADADKPRGWPADIDEIVRAYAKVCGETEMALWNRALQLHGAHEAKRTTRRARSRGRRREDA